jgi:hypothetical protein
MNWVAMFSVCQQVLKRTRSRSLRSSRLRSSSPSSSKRTLARTEYWQPPIGPRRARLLELEGLPRRRSRTSTDCDVWSGSAEPGSTRASSRVERLLPPSTFSFSCDDSNNDTGLTLLPSSFPGASASFSLMVYSASVAVQALTVISMGGLADDSKSSSFALLRLRSLLSALNSD